MEVIRTRLTDGVPVCIRRVRQEDEARLKAGIALLTAKSRYLRFFSGMREAPQAVIDRLVDVDDHDHVAWGALRPDRADTPALGVVHAFRKKGDREAAEFSVAVIDAYHGRGLARLLTAVLLLDCQREGFERFVVHILAENTPAQSLVRSLGARSVGHDLGVQIFEIDIADAIAALQKEVAFEGLEPVFAHFGQ